MRPFILNLSTISSWTSGDHSDSTAGRCDNARTAEVYYSDALNSHATVHWPDVPEKRPPEKFKPPRKMEARFVPPKFHFKDYRYAPPRNRPR